MINSWQAYSLKLGQASPLASLILNLLAQMLDALPDFSLVLLLRVLPHLPLPGDLNAELVSFLFHLSQYPLFRFLPRIFILLQVFHQVLLQQLELLLLELLVGVLAIGLLLPRG